MLPFSILDLSPITAGSTPAQSLRSSLDLAQHAERWGYRRYWLAEHHNSPGIASAATAVVIGHVAGGTSTIRVGAGGIMLPNHAPLMIAEQFGTLESLYPGRIDLGVGRAPGTDQLTARALRRNLSSDADEFPQDVVELMGYFQPAQPDQAVRAIPGAGLSVPMWILGSSLYGAQVAAAFGLPFAFASHFAPAQMMQAIHVYRDGFRPSQQLERPYLMLGFSMYAADSDEDARTLASSVQQSTLSQRMGRPIPVPPPVAGFMEGLAPRERAIIGDKFECAAIGSPATVREALKSFIARTQPDELILACNMYDHAARLRSYEIAASVRDAL